MRDELYLGAVPNEEECIQVGSKNYLERAEAECEQYIKVLKTKFQDMPDGLEFEIKHCPHDFGTYLEVVVTFDRYDEEQSEYAIKIENNRPEYWEDKE